MKKVGKYNIEVTGESNNGNIREVFARVFNNDEQIGFGKDGSVDIERFRFVNFGDRDIYQAIAETVDVKKQKFDSSNIIEGKIGNTTTTVYPTIDGQLTRNTGAGGTGEAWATLKAGAGTGVDTTTANVNGVISFVCDTTSNQWRVIQRFILSFDTSAIGSDDIDSAIFSIRGTGGQNPIAGVNPAMNIYEATPASDTALVAADFSEIGTTAWSSAIAFGSYNTSGYNDFTLNATGEAGIDGSGYTNIGIRESVYDAGSSTPNWQNDTRSDFDAYSRNQTGTATDPKLVIEHSESSTTYYATVSESMSATDTISAPATFNKELSEVISENDDITKSTIFSKTFSDSVDGSDTFGKISSFNVSKSDVITLSDIVTVLQRPIVNNVVEIDNLDTSAPISYNAGTGSNRKLLVYVGMSFDNAVTGFTYNGVALTKSIDKKDPYTYTNVGIWYLDNPAEGSNTLVATTADDTVCSLIISYITNAGNITATASNNGDSTTLAVSITPTAANKLLLAGLVSNSDTTALTPTAGITELGKAGPPSAGLQLLGAYSKTSVGTGAETLSATGPSDGWCAVAVEISLPSSVIEFLNLAEAISTLDDFSKTITFGKTLLESMNMTDSITRTAIFSINKSENMSLNDIISAIKGFLISISENIGLTEILSKTSSFAKTLSENVSISDTVITIKTFFVDVAESLSINDTLTKVANYIKSIAEDIGLTEILTNSTSFVKTLSENISITDTVTNLRKAFINAVETITTSDTFSRVISFSKTLVENLGLVDIFKGKFPWQKGTKNTSTWSKGSKNTSTWTKGSKNTTTWTKGTKN